MSTDTGRSVAASISRALAIASSSDTPPSRRPSVNAKPELVVASAWKPSAASTLAEPASHGFGMMNGSLSRRARNASVFVVTPGTYSDNSSVPLSEPVRRRQAGVLIVGAAEPEITPWLHAAGHSVRAVRTVKAAGPALEEQPVDLVIVDRDPSGLDAPAVARKLREDERLGDAWLLVITVQARGRAADAALNAGADDYLHRPFTRAELLARARAGLRAAQHRQNDALLRTLMDNVPGAIYRSAWHDNGS